MENTTTTMGEQKTIAIVAHDNKKQDLLAWAKFNRVALAGHHLIATGTTGKLLSTELDLPVTKLQSGPLGGDQQIGAAVTLVNARFAKPIDAELLRRLAREHDAVLSVEDHALPGGFGAAVGEAILEGGLTLKLRRLGVADELVPHATREQQLAQHGLDAAGIEQVLREELGLEARPAARIIPFAG